MNKTKELKTSSCVHVLDPVCMQCQASQFSKNESDRQKAVIKKYGKLPPDCVSSPMDGIKCPFKTGKAFVNGNRTQKIPRNGIGYSRTFAEKQYC